MFATNEAAKPLRLIATITAMMLGMRLTHGDSSTVTALRKLCDSCAEKIVVLSRRHSTLAVSE